MFAMSVVTVMSVIRVLSTVGEAGGKLPPPPPKGLPVIIQELLFMPNNAHAYHTRIEI